MKYLFNILLVISVMYSFALTAKTYTLPDGKVLEDPYVMAERPDGLEIGHKIGVTFVKFADLPESVQKKYHYVPKNAAEFETKVKNVVIDTKKIDAEDALARQKQQTQMDEWTLTKFNTEIQKTQNRIDFLKGEIPRLEQRSNDLFDKSVEMAHADVLPNQTFSGSTGNCYVWHGGFVTTGGGQKAARNRALKTVTDESVKVKRTLSAYKKELQEKENSLISMKEACEQIKKKEEAEKAKETVEVKK